jgi:hypothetical protein
LPICSSCKKIRDDEGYWTQLETYIDKYSDAVFSHGICPACCENLYPEQFEAIYGKKVGAPNLIDWNRQSKKSAPPIITCDHHHSRPETDLKNCG